MDLTVSLGCWFFSCAIYDFIAVLIRQVLFRYAICGVVLIRLLCYFLPAWRNLVTKYWLFHFEVLCLCLTTDCLYWFLVRDKLKSRESRKFKFIGPWALESVFFFLMPRFLVRRFDRKITLSLEFLSSVFSLAALHLRWINFVVHIFDSPLQLSQPLLPLCEKGTVELSWRHTKFACRILR